MFIMWIDLTPIVLRDHNMVMSNSLLTPLILIWMMSSTTSLVHVQVCYVMSRG